MINMGNNLQSNMINIGNNLQSNINSVSDNLQSNINSVSDNLQSNINSVSDNLDKTNLKLKTSSLYAYKPVGASTKRPWTVQYDKPVSAINGGWHFPTTSDIPLVTIDTYPNQPEYSGSYKIETNLNVYLPNPDTGIVSTNQYKENKEGNWISCTGAIKKRGLSSVSWKQCGFTCEIRQKDYRNDIERNAAYNLHKSFPGINATDEQKTQWHEDKSKVILLDQINKSLLPGFTRMNDYIFSGGISQRSDSLLGMRNFFHYSLMAHTDNYALKHAPKWINLIRDGNYEGLYFLQEQKRPRNYNVETDKGGFISETIRINGDLSINRAGQTLNNNNYEEQGFTQGVWSITNICQEEISTNSDYYYNKEIGLSHMYGYNRPKGDTSDQNIVGMREYQRIPFSNPGNRQDWWDEDNDNSIFVQYKGQDFRDYMKKKIQDNEKFLLNDTYEIWSRVWDVKSWADSIILHMLQGDPDTFVEFGVILSSEDAAIQRMPWDADRSYGTNVPVMHAVQKTKAKSGLKRLTLNPDANVTGLNMSTDNPFAEIQLWHYQRMLQFVEFRKEVVDIWLNGYCKKVCVNWNTYVQENNLDKKYKVDTALFGTVAAFKKYVENFLMYNYEYIQNSLIDTFKRFPGYEQGYGSTHWFSVNQDRYSNDKSSLQINQDGSIEFRKTYLDNLTHMINTIKTRADYLDTIFSSLEKITNMVNDMKPLISVETSRKLFTVYNSADSNTHLGHGILTKFNNFKNVFLQRVELTSDVEFKLNDIVKDKDNSKYSGKIWKMFKYITLNLENNNNIKAGDIIYSNNKYYGVLTVVSSTNYLVEILSDVSNNIYKEKYHANLDVTETTDQVLIIELDSSVNYLPYDPLNDVIIESITYTPNQVYSPTAINNFKNIPNGTEVQPFSTAISLYKPVNKNGTINTNYNPLVVINNDFSIEKGGDGESDTISFSFSLPAWYVYPNIYNGPFFVTPGDVIIIIAEESVFNECERHMFNCITGALQKLLLGLSYAELFAAINPWQKLTNGLDCDIYTEGVYSHMYQSTCLKEYREENDGLKYFKFHTFRKRGTPNATGSLSAAPFDNSANGTNFKFKPGKTYKVRAYMIPVLGAKMSSDPSVRAELSNDGFGMFRAESNPAFGFGSNEGTLNWTPDNRAGTGVGIGGVLEPEPSTTSLYDFKPPSGGTFGLVTSPASIPACLGASEIYHVTIPYDETDLIFKPFKYPTEVVEFKNNPPTDRLTYYDPDDNEIDSNRLVDIMSQNYLHPVISSTPGTIPPLVSGWRPTLPDYKPLVPAPPGTQKIFYYEVSTKLTGQDDYVILINESPETVDLSGWKLSDSKNTYTITSLELSSNEKVIIDENELGFGLSKDGETMVINDGTSDYTLIVMENPGEKVYRRQSDGTYEWVSP